MTDLVVHWRRSVGMWGYIDGRWTGTGLGVVHVFNFGIGRGIYVVLRAHR